jgi:SNF2 family DNA or RNA helicase
MLPLKRRPCTLKLKPFQVKDLAAASLKEGVILAWEQGLGKTIAALLWPQLRRAHRALIIAPASLHDQLVLEAAKHCGISLNRLASIADARAAGLDQPLPTEYTRTRFYLVSWEALCRNKSLERFDLDKYDEEELPEGHWAEGVGETQNGIFCCYTPSLATQLAAWGAMGAGIDCAVADEGTRLQADDSLLSTALRRLIPANRLILSGTPIKNKLDSIFWLAWWVAGGSPTPTALWPYEGTSKGRAAFADQHLQHDRFYTREAEAAAANPDAKARRIEKRSNRACNIERLYKLLAPLVLRRRKTQCGTSMQDCTYHPVHVPPGTHQYTAYNRIAGMKTITAANGRVLTKAREVTARRLELMKECCLAPWSSHLPHRSPHTYTPKTQAVLSLVEQALSRGEQVLIGSPYRAFTDMLVATLKEAGVRVSRCDGTENPATRALIAANFKRHQSSVMVAGLKAMAEGHDFAQCPNLILPAYSWAMDEVEQFIHRVWRLVSPQPVKIFLVFIQGTLDERLEKVHGEKKDTSSLVLDGELTPETKDPISLEQLLAETLALNQHLPNGPLTENEVHLAMNSRPRFMRALRVAQTRYDEWHPPTVATNPPVTTADSAAAVAALSSPADMNALDFIRRSQLLTQPKPKPNDPPQ